MIDYSDLLKSEIKPAFGCTEPIALAFTAAKAVEVLGEFPSHMIATCSGNIIKNAKSVTIPNSNGHEGIEYSVILGALVGNSKAELQVLESLTPELVKQAEVLYNQSFCEVALEEGEENLYINIYVTTEHGHSARVIVAQRHTNVVRIEIDGAVTYEQNVDEQNQIEMVLSFASCLEYANHADLSPVQDLLEQQLNFNMAIAEEGIRNNYGSNIGKIILEDSTSLTDKARAYAAAGSDARMNGCNLPVMINCGSGNQGITLAVPLQVYANEYKVSKERLYRALILANLLALYVKKGIGRLSAYCGVVSSSAAEVAAIAYLLGESEDIIEHTMSNALVGTSGVICDGAKASCAMKIALSLSNAFLAYKQAKTSNNFRPGDGIMKNNLDETIKTVGKIAKDGMKETDVVVLNTMIDKF